MRQECICRAAVRFSLMAGPPASAHGFRLRDVSAASASHSPGGDPSAAAPQAQTDHAEV